MFNFVQWKISSFICMFIPIYCPDFYHSKRKGFFSSFFSVEAKVNYAFDQLMEWLRGYFKDSGYDPYKLSDKMIWDSPLEFPQGTQWNNRFEFYNGTMHNLSTLHRIHNAELEYSLFTNQFELRGNVAFNHIKIIYDFAAKLMNLGPRGKLIAHIPLMRAKFRITFQVDSGQLRTELKEFAIENTKDVRLSAEGFGPLNALVVHAAKGTMYLLSFDYKDALLRTLETRLRENIESALKAYSDDDLERNLGTGDGRGDERGWTKPEEGGRGDETGEERKGTDNKEEKEKTHRSCLFHTGVENVCEDECGSDIEDSEVEESVDFMNLMTILNELKKSVQDIINVYRRKQT